MDFDMLTRNDHGYAYSELAAGLRLQDGPAARPGGKARAGVQRRHERRDSDSCVSVIAGQTYPVENWSMGGLLVFGDPRPFGLDSEIDVTMKFRVRGRVFDIVHRARVVRKTYDHVAFSFLPLTRQIQKGFRAVLDDYIASKFAESQTA